MTVPGPVTSAMSVGCHYLLRHCGARLVTSYAEVLEEVGRIGDDLAPIPRGPERAEDRLGPELSRVLDGVPFRGPADAGQIAAAAGVPLRDALRALPALESGGYIVAKDGGYVTTADRRAAATGDQRAVATADDKRTVTTADKRAATTGDHSAIASGDRHDPAHPSANRPGPVP